MCIVPEEKHDLYQECQEILLGTVILEYKYFWGKRNYLLKKLRSKYFWQKESQVLENKGVKKIGRWKEPEQLSIEYAIHIRAQGNESKNMVGNKNHGTLL